MIDIDIYATLRGGPAPFVLDVQLSSKQRRIALLGPSGAGKTQMLHAIAGLTRPDRGKIVVDGLTLFDSNQGVCLSAQARKVAYVHQDYALFPHLTVAQNILFGLSRGWRNPSARGAIPAEAGYWIEAFELGGVLGSYPQQISGGQKQRVALARALALGPRLLLMDEPLSALDAALRSKMRQELLAMQTRLNIPTVLITHDLEDAICLADLVFCIADGRIVRTCEERHA